VAQTGQTWEQQSVLTGEERTWHKSVRKPRKEGDTTEQVWLNDVVLDSRIGERMRRFVLEPEEEARAKRIASGAEQSRAVPIQDLRAEKVVLGDIDEE
jgi:import inner membrane translocase subunit TIM54